MLKSCSRSQMGSVKKKGAGASVLQDMNFLSLKEFYNSIPGDETIMSIKMLIN